MSNRRSPSRQTVFVLLSCLTLTIMTNLGAAENLVVNGSFDSDIDGWQGSQGIRGWDALDVNGSPGSGSILMLNNLATNSVINVNQCVPVSENVTYGFGGWNYLVPGAPTTSTGTILVYIYANTSCSGVPLGSAITTQNSVTGTWSDLSSFIVVPAAGSSAQLRLRLNKTNGGVDVEGHWDDVFMVSLDDIFSDGFESSQN